MFAGTPISLSVQEVLDCSEKPKRRELIAMDAFAYIQKYGVTRTSSYPGRGLDKETCQRNYTQPRTRIRSFRLINPGDEKSLQTAVALFGPVSVSIKVTTNFFFYKSGVFFDPACNDGQRATNHAVLLVGYGTDDIGGDYWIIQNNWGSWWGEDGFARLTRSSKMNCEISSAAIYPVF